MTTRVTPISELFRDDLSLLLTSGQRPEHLARAIIDLLKQYSLQSPDEPSVFHAIAASILEAHRSSQQICLAALSIVKLDRDSKYSEPLVLVLQSALQASPSLHGERGSYHIILSALEVPCLQHASLEACETILTDQSTPTAPRERREFARELLALFRRGRLEDPLKERIKSHAHSIFTLGQLVTSQPALVPPPQSQDVEPNHEKQDASRVLLNLIMQRPPSSTLDRLTGEDFNRIGELSGLSLEQFKITVETLSLYAARDGGALDAFLRIAKAEHDAMVSVQTRTQALASFLAISRRRGGLSHEIERQILATSAQIPELSFSGGLISESAEAQTD
jgi:hypothetical protein